MFPTSLRVFVAAKPIDLRISFDRLAGIVRDQFGGDPRAGHSSSLQTRRRTAARSYSQIALDIAFSTSGSTRGPLQLPVSKDSTDARVAVDADAFARLLEGVAREVGRRPRRIH